MAEERTVRTVKGMGCPLGEAGEEIASYKFTVKGSRFLSSLFSCSSQSQAREILKGEKTKYPSATHVVHAFITGKKGEVRGQSDDGEPRGTAGRQVMSALIEKRDLTFVMLTVTRWFGGTLLGTAGLSRAYKDAAKGVLSAAEMNGAFIELAITEAFCFACDYGTYEKLRRVMANFHLQGVTEQYGEEVKVQGNVRQDEAKDFFAAIAPFCRAKQQSVEYGWAVASSAFSTQDIRLQISDKLQAASDKQETRGGQYRPLASNSTFRYL